VEFTITTNAGNKQREIVATLLAEDLRKLGMKVKFAPLDFNLLVSQLYTGEGWEVMVMGLTGGNPDPNSSANIWKSSGNLHMWNVGWDEPQTEWEARIDEIYEQAAITVDPEARRRLYYEAQEIIAEQVPMIYTVNQTVFYAVRNKWVNIKPTAYGGVLHNLEVMFAR
jgi:peptide/nickel transport system substrate-binding protein